MIYRNHQIVTDTEDGATFTYVYLPNADDYGTDPIEVIGGIPEAKALIDNLVSELRAAHGFGHADEFDGYAPNSDRERFGPYN